MSKEQELINELQEYLDIEDTSGIDLYPEEVQMCIEALEKQIAKKPKIIYEHIEDNGLYDLSFMCLSCDMNTIGQYYRPSYCKHCGQKLDWSEVE